MMSVSFVPITLQEPMNIADEIEKLNDLHRSGALSDAEFEAAKAKLLTALPAAPPAPISPAAPVMSPEASLKQWGLFLHLSLLAGFLVPLGGLIVPIVIWQMKKQEIPGIDEHGCNAVNFIISMIIYGVLCIPLCFIIIGIPLLMVLGILGVVFPIIAALKANDGVCWKYPMAISFLKPSNT